MFTVQEIAAQATDQIARVIIVGSLVIGLVIAIQGAAIFMWA